MEYKIWQRIRSIQGFMTFDRIDPSWRFNRYSENTNQNPDEVTIKFEKLTQQLEVYISRENESSKPSKDITVDTGLIKEIRPGKHAKAFQSRRNMVKKFDNSQCLTILYGEHFVLSSISLSSLSKDHIQILQNALEQVVKDNRQLSYGAKLECWILKTFYEVRFDDKGEEMTLDEVKAFTIKVGYPISSIDLQRAFQERSSNGLMSFDQFYPMVKSWIHNQQIFTDCFGPFAFDGTLSKLTPTEVEKFLKEGQKETSLRPWLEFCTDKSLKAENEYTNSNLVGLNNEHIPEEMLVDYLFSKQNSIYGEIQVSQDMTRPLSHYWIASSHNTYLTGNQITSESSVEAYVRCLRMGCRCIELDCWDGDNGTPVVYHGHTLTTKISFTDVLVAIKDHAFVTSNYPVILSIENHCGKKQQSVMAKKFKEVFGSMLVNSTSQGTKNSLLSPEEWKRKIILKCKRTLSESRSYVRNSVNVFSNIHRGEMFVQNKNGTWLSYFFALNRSRLLYRQISDSACEAKNDARVSKQSVESTNPEQIYLNEKWFHGTLLSHESDARAEKFAVHGAFLVRDSAKNPGEFVLCFWYHNSAKNIKIQKQMNEQNRLIYHLRTDSNKTFPSLFSLVCYYQNNPLVVLDRSNTTRVVDLPRLSTPIPIPQEWESEEWFYRNMTRTEATAILSKISMNGSFLVRYAHTLNNPQLVISFRYTSTIKHCRIREIGTSLIVSTKKFPNIVRLVEYYRKHAFYKGIKLEHPLDNNLYEMTMSQETTEGVAVTSSDVGYIYTANTDELTLSVQAIRDYTAPPGSPDVLSFMEGEIITNVIKEEDSEWWIGDLRNSTQKSFPAAFVTVLESSTESNKPQECLEDGSIQLGPTYLIRTGDKEFPFILEICFTPIPFRTAVKSELDAKIWQEKINKCYRENKGEEMDGISLTFLDRCKKIFRQKSHSSDTERRKSSDLQRLINIATVSPKKPNRARISSIADQPAHNEISSYSESVVPRYMGDDPGSYCHIHSIQLCRIYPSLTRIHSTNYNPIFLWNTGCQLVSLNYQKQDKWMQVNVGKFLQNGNCGYVLKPWYMICPDTSVNFNPNDPNLLEELGIKEMDLSITVIAARNLMKYGIKPASDPLIEIEILGTDFDLDLRRTRQRAALYNGLCPFWNQKFSFTIRNPDLALIRFAVQDKDAFNDSCFIGQATLPVSLLRPGYRSVQLLSRFGEELMSVLLVRVQKTIRE